MDGIRGQRSELTEGVVELVAEELEQVALYIQRHRKRREHGEVDEQPKQRDPVEVAVRPRAIFGPRARDGSVSRALDVGLRQQVRGAIWHFLPGANPGHEDPAEEKYGAKDVCTQTRCQARAQFPMAAV